MSDDALAILANAPVIGLLAIIVILLTLTLVTLVRAVTSQSGLTVNTLKTELDIQRGAMREQRERLERLTDSNAELRITVGSLQNTIKELTADKRTIETSRDEWKANWVLITSEVTALKDRIRLLEALMTAGGIAIPPTGSTSLSAREPLAPPLIPPQVPPDA